MKHLIIFVFAAMLLTSGCQNNYSASVMIENEVTVTMTVRPIFGIHSDWYRTLTVSTSGGQISENLFEDTGWWRGSNLYLHISGAYVLHEGQAGCRAFSTSPAAFVSNPAISCKKLAKPLPVEASKEAGLRGKPGSRFYPDLFYIGRFEEAPRDPAPVKFIDKNEKPEVELPDIL